MLNDFQTEIENEMPRMAGKGRIVKVRFLDQDHPNVVWIWLAVGNCDLCVKNVPALTDNLNPRCTDRRVTHKDYQKYLDTNTCPFFVAGHHGYRYLDNSNSTERQNVLKAVGLVSGEPTERIQVLQNLPWTPANSERAHEQAAHFLLRARQYDSGNDNTGQEAIDYTDDLGDIQDGSEPDAAAKSVRAA